MPSPQKALLLAIESSCDECSVAVVTGGAGGQVAVLANVVHSQIELHRPFGGVVPENASRNHLEVINTVIDQALGQAGLTLRDISAIGVTNGPGLIGALLVGVSTAKALAYSLKLPLIAVNHLSGHLHSLFIEGQKSCGPMGPEHLPLLVCLVSGGHTALYLLESLPPAPLKLTLLGKTRDDAAGEAFDKGAKLLGLPYPGGKHIDELAKKGNAKAFSFPRPLRGHDDLSFSGLKTAVANELIKQGFKPHVFGAHHKETLPQGQVLYDLCASLQAAIIDTLFERVERAINIHHPRGLALVGGVSANSALRTRLQTLGDMSLFFPDGVYCTDNAAMIGATAYYAWQRGEALLDDKLLSLNAYSRMDN
jgi:N6-L-threonylcarbamoyladenine synthase